MSRRNVFLSSILAGVSIALGGVVFLSLDNKVIGAVLFSVGLFTVCTFGLNLFTGKVCYVFEKKGGYVLDLGVIWTGNLVGTFATAQLICLTRIGAAVTEKAVQVCTVKLNDSPGSIFILAMFCNVLIYIAVDGYGKNPHTAAGYLAIFFGVIVFILCGFEHCIANMFYFSVSGMWSGKSILYLLIMTLGNAVGGVVFPLTRSFLKCNS